MIETALLLIAGLFALFALVISLVGIGVGIWMLTR